MPAQPDQKRFELTHVQDLGGDLRVSYKTKASVQAWGYVLKLNDRTLTLPSGASWVFSEKDCVELDLTHSTPEKLKGLKSLEVLSGLGAWLPVYTIPVEDLRQENGTCSYKLVLPPGRYFVRTCGERRLMAGTMLVTSESRQSFDLASFNDRGRGR